MTSDGDNIGSENRNDRSGSDTGKFPAQIRGAQPGLATVMSNAGNVPVEFASKGLFADCRDRPGEMPLLQRGVCFVSD